MFYRLLYATIICLFLSLKSVLTPVSGAIVLVGSNTVPEKAIEWFKQQSLPGEFAVITRNFERAEKWNAILDNVVFYTPEDFRSIVGVAGIVICGGDQWDYLTVLDGGLIQKAHDSGIPILGISAGAMILGEYYFSAEKDTISCEDILNNTHGDRICIGHKFVHISYLRGCLVDTHFTERERRGRAVAFLNYCKAERVLGIDEATAMCINYRETKIFGVGRVHYIHQ